MHAQPPPKKKKEENKKKYYNPRSSEENPKRWFHEDLIVFNVLQETVFWENIIVIYFLIKNKGTAFWKKIIVEERELKYVNRAIHSLTAQAFKHSDQKNLHEQLKVLQPHFQQSKSFTLKQFKLGRNDLTTLWEHSTGIDGPQYTMIHEKTVSQSHSATLTSMPVRYCKQLMKLANKLELKVMT